MNNMNYRDVVLSTADFFDRNNENATNAPSAHITCELVFGLDRMTTDNAMMMLRVVSTLEISTSYYLHVHHVVENLLSSRQICRTRHFVQQICNKPVLKGVIWFEILSQRVESFRTVHNTQVL